MPEVYARNILDIQFCDSTLNMPTDSQLDRIRRRRMRQAVRKLKEAQGQLARTEQSIIP